MKPKKTIEVKVERRIPASVDAVFAGWLNPEIPGNPWHMADKLILNPEVDGLFYWAIHETAHYGRFTEVHRPDRIQHTWVSPNTLGFESSVKVTFTQQADETLMTLVHSGLPDTESGRSHDNGWNYFLDNFTERFSSAPTPETTR